MAASVRNLAAAAVLFLAICLPQTAPQQLAGGSRPPLAQAGTQVRLPPDRTCAWRLQCGAASRKAFCGLANAPLVPPQGGACQALGSCPARRGLELPLELQAPTGPAGGNGSNDSSSSGGGGSGGGGDEHGETFILRFREYQMAEEHRQQLQRALEGRGLAWRWVPRHNPASRFPTDFGLVQLPGGLEAAKVRRWAFAVVLRLAAAGAPAARTLCPLHSCCTENGIPVAPGELLCTPRLWQRQSPALPCHMQGQLLGLGFVKGVHPDRQLSQSLLAEAAAPGAAGPVATGGSSDDDELRVQKRPGRMQTRPTYSLEENQGWDEEEEAVAAGAGSSLPRRVGNDSDPAAAAQQQRRRVLATGRSQSQSLPHLLGADQLWEQGFRGQRVKMGVFDTGVRGDHPHIKNIRQAGGRLGRAGGRLERVKWVWLWLRACCPQR